MDYVTPQTDLTPEMLAQEFYDGFRTAFTCPDVCISEYIGVMTSRMHKLVHQDVQKIIKKEELLSPTAISNAITMGIACEIDSRQTIPDAPCIPNEETRRLRAELIFEEAMETIRGLGFAIAPRIRYVTAINGKDDVTFKPDHIPDLEQIIDGCVDVNYVP